MPTSTFDDHEIEMIVLALRFWRAQRGTGATRRTDSSFVSPDDVDFLIAKLQSQKLAAAARTSGVSETRAGLSR